MCVWVVNRAHNKRVWHRRMVIETRTQKRQCMWRTGAGGAPTTVPVECCIEENTLNGWELQACDGWSKKRSEGRVSEDERMERKRRGDVGRD